MPNTTISIGFKMQSGANGLQSLTLDAKDLKMALNAVTTEVQQMNTDFINFAALCTGIEGLKSTLSSCMATLTEWTGAYSAQVEVEKKLEVNMQNTMSATDEEIQSIKDLCSAQQQLGVVGDEVQLAGAQNLAAFLQQKDSLEALIPAMNDLIVKQYGLNATQENAAQIAGAMGKAFSGQAAVLRRYEITFDENQKKILECGTETEKTAIIVQAITDKFGGLNQEMAKTDPGKFQQFKNKIGDYKEILGGYVQSLMKFIIGTQNFANAFLGISKLAGAYNAAHKALIAFITQKKVLNALLIIGSGSTQKAARLMDIYTNSLKGGAAHAKVLSIAMRSLLVTTGVGIAISALIYIISKFCSTSDEAVDKANALKVGEEEYTQAAAQAKLSIDKEISSLKDIIDSNQDATDTVRRLNSEYGDIFGAHETAAEWYDTLTTKSRNYVKQLGLEARAKAIMPKLAEAIIEKDDAADEMRKLEEEGKAKTIRTTTRYNRRTGTYSDTTKTIETPEYKAARERKEAAEATETALQAQLDATTEAAKKNAATLNHGQAGYNRQLKVTEMNLNQVGDAVTDTEAKLRSTIDKKYSDLKAYNAQLAARKKHLEKLTGLGSKSSTGRTLVKHPKTDKELSNNISIYKYKVTGEDTEEQRAILAQIKNWENMRKAIQEVYDEMERPAEIKCLEDFDKELNNPRKKRSKASGEAIAELDAQIESVEDMRQEYERQSHPCRHQHPAPRQESHPSRKTYAPLWDKKETRPKPFQPSMTAEERLKRFEKLK
ncbi:MAG: hypothetical protein HDS99_01935 [Bacteroidales bacterium]|nr:hypothetical protein [Bacteroidales bacterium]